MTEQHLVITASEIFADYDWNCRRDTSIEACTSLAASIKDKGLDIPITVRLYKERGFKYQVVCGFKRFRAITEILKHKQIAAFVRDLDDYEAKLLNFRENAEREQLTFWEDCLFIKSTFPPEVQQTQIQEDLGKPYNWVRPRRQIWDLPKSIVQLAEQGVYTARDIGELLKRDPAEQQASAKAAERAVGRGESAKEVRKATVKRRSVRGRKSMQRMTNAIEEHQLCDSKIQHILLWAISDIDKVELAKRLGQSADIFLAVEE